MTTTPLHDVHTGLGAKLTDFAGWTMPLRYAGDLAEHHAVRTAAGLFDLSHMGELEVVGPQAAEALDAALVSELASLPVLRAKYTMLRSPDGGVLDDLVVYRLATEHFLVIANAANTDVVLGALRERAAGWRASVYDRRADWALLAVQGPASPAILGAVTDADLAALRYYTITSATVAGRAALLARTGYTGEDGFEISCAPHDAAPVWRALTEAGAPHGLRPAGLACRDALRLEAGMPLYGHELSRERTPYAAGLGRVVHLAGEFVGRAALARAAGREPEQRLVGLLGEGRRSPRAGYPVLAADGRPVGQVTSGALSPTLRRPIALGYVDAGHAALGQELRVDVRGAALPVTVTAPPFSRRPR